MSFEQELHARGSKAEDSGTDRGLSDTYQNFVRGDRHYWDRNGRADDARFCLPDCLTFSIFLSKCWKSLQLLVLGGQASTNIARWVSLLK